MCGRLGLVCSQKRPPPPYIYLYIDIYGQNFVLAFLYVSPVVRFTVTYRSPVVEVVSLSFARPNGLAL